MLELKNIKKNYFVGNQVVPALKGIDLTFKKNEFVSILGPSGCGKTTLLNIIGGLDHYTDGDLLIDGKSTKTFKDENWDSYRNTTIGFVFQNYNLISHLSVSDNVEMALSLSGIHKKERVERTHKILDQVGLKDQIHKFPNQLSGGQMQRVAIARALINNPKILLADEPTGALDTHTSDQIMRLIQEISKDRLVIMVTHNPEIANEYSDRIINLLDGVVEHDSNPTDQNEQYEVAEKLVNKKTSMSYFQALRTSFKNLITKKGRTIITVIAGSIGIIGVALVLGLGSGMTDYVNDIEQNTLSGFPVTINEYSITTVGPAARAEGTGLFGNTTGAEFPSEQIIFAYDATESTEIHQNIITGEFLTYLENMDQTLISSIGYSTGIELNVVSKTDAGTYTYVNSSSGDISSNTVSMFDSSSIFTELPNNQEFVESQYDILAGTYPTNYDEIALVIDSQNQLDIEVLDALGIDLETDYTFEDMLGSEIKVVLNNTYYTEENGIYKTDNDYERMYNSSDSITLTVSAILRVNEEATSELLPIGVTYLKELTETVQGFNSTSDVVIAQSMDTQTNVLTGKAFNDYITYDSVMRKIGGDDTITSIQIYPSSYSAKEEVKLYIDAYNVLHSSDDEIVYQDLAEVLSGTISGLIDTITIVLTGFAGISLVVSSIMIGIITYVSVIERTKEIGIMRSLGARKKDISRIFNAETILIGLSSGALGVVIFYLLQIPVNRIVGKMIGVAEITQLSVAYAMGLILLSSILTLIAGMFPSRLAAKKDPVESLRTE